MRNFILSALIAIFAFLSTTAQSFELGRYPGQRISLPLPYDFDGDGKLDVIGVSRGFSSEGDLTFYRSIGDSITIDFEVQDLGYTVLGNPGAGDFDGDGDIDIVAHLEESRRVSIFLNNGEGEFLIGFQMSNSSDEFRVADLDNDSDMDIVSWDTDSGVGYFWTNDGNGQFDQFKRFIRSSNLRTIEVQDMDDDGLIDIVVGLDAFINGGIIVYKNNGDATFQNVSLSNEVDGGLENIRLIDINLDGHMDVTYSSFRSSMLKSLLGSENLTFTNSDIVRGLDNLRSFEIADYNQDGIMDVVLGCNDERNTYHQGLSTTSFDFDQEVISSIQPMFRIQNADLNSDGYIDLILSNGDFWWAQNKLKLTNTKHYSTEKKTIHVFPCPFSESISIMAEKDYHGAIYDVHGKAVLNQFTTPRTIEVNHLTNGNYFLILRDPHTGEIVHSQIILK